MPASGLAVNGGNRDALRAAFLNQRLSNILACDREFLAAMEIDDIVEVARAASLAQSPDLLCEHLLVAVAHDLAGSGERVGVGMRDWPTERRTDHGLCAKKVYLHAARRRGPPGTPVVDPAFCRQGRDALAKSGLRCAEVNAGGFCHTFEDSGDDRHDLIRLDWSVR